MLEKHSLQSRMPELITLTMRRLSNKLSRGVVIETLVKKASRKDLVCKFSSWLGRVVNSNGSMMILPSIFDPNQSGHNNLRSWRHSYKKDGFLVHFNYKIKSEHARRLEGDPARTSEMGTQKPAIAAATRRLDKK